MWVEKIMNRIATDAGASSSLWGCELKKWEVQTYLQLVGGHPPCEDVSWKVTRILAFAIIYRHPPCEDVSWKVDTGTNLVKKFSHPPCEDVSWKNTTLEQDLDRIVILLVRMWVEKQVLWTTWIFGCRHPPCEDVSWKGNSLLTSVRVSSHPPCEDVSWKKRMM